jgi:hypothetical protein
MAAGIDAAETSGRSFRLQAEDVSGLVKNAAVTTRTFQFTTNRISGDGGLVPISLIARTRR